MVATATRHKKEELTNWTKYQSYNSAFNLFVISQVRHQV